jgi:adenosylhomocysteinase
MDMSFANQALATQFIAEQSKSLRPDVIPVPKEIDDRVAELKLRSLGVGIDTLTPEQAKYLSSYDVGT